MSTFFGADVGELRQLAGTFESAAAQLTRTRTGVGGNVQSSPWSGPVAFRFRSTWDSQSGVQLAAASEALTIAAASLRKNANDQETASSASGSAGSGTSASHPAQSRLNDLLSFAAKLGVDGANLAIDGHDLLASLAKGGSLSKLSEFTKGLSGLKTSQLLSVVGMGYSAFDLGDALATGNTAEGIRSSLDLLAGGVGVFVPGAGLAWEGGTLIGTGIANGVEQVWDYQGGAVAEGAREMFGDGVNLNDLTPAQATALTDRYNGVGGVVQSMTDTVNGGIYDLAKWIIGQ